MKRIVFFITAILIPILLISQSSLISKGDEYYNTFQYELAKDYYLKAVPSLKSQEEKATVNYKQGICFKN